jgi:chemotaxis protein CheC
VPAVEFGLFADKILLVQTKFSDDVELDGFFILIPDMESYEKILTVLGVI